MSVDQNWELIFRENSWGKYPSEDVVRFVARNFYKSVKRESVRILDLGCGGGAHAWYLAREGFNVVAIDGSESAVEHTRALLAKDGLSAQFFVGDVADLDFEPGSFDAIIDSSCIQHNRWEQILKIHSDVYALLRDGGQFLSILLSDESNSYRGAIPLEKSTYTNFDSCFLSRSISAHFFSSDDVADIFSRYEFFSVDSATRTASGGSEIIAHRIVSARKGLGKKL